MRIGVDLDGVCYDYAASLRKYICDETGRDQDEFPDPVRWDFYEDWGMDYPTFKSWSVAGVKAGVVFYAGIPAPGVEDGIRKLRQAGHTVHIVTARNYGGAQAWNNTVNWLAKFGIEVDTLTFSNDKTLVKTDVFIEDNIDNFSALTASGVDAYMMHQRWNSAFDARTKRVYSFGDFVNRVLR